MGDGSRISDPFEQLVRRLGSTPPPPATGSAKTLFQSIKRSLVRASDAGVLSSSQYELNELVRLTPDVQNRQHWILTGGLGPSDPKNFKRDLTRPHLARADGAWFDFAVTLRETKRSIETLAYDFEIRFPESLGGSFLRFDLNLPGHDNEARDLRSHFHPGHDDLLVPTTELSPTEILYLFVYGFCRPDGRKQRS